LRTDLGMPDVPFIGATLGDFIVEKHSEAEVVNNALRQLPHQVKLTACIESEGLKHRGDGVHFDSASARELGRRYAEAMIRL